MRLRWLLVAFGIVLAVGVTGCKDQGVRDWLTSYTQAEQAYFDHLERKLENHRIRICALEGADPCPIDDPVVPKPPTYP